MTSQVPEHIQAIQPYRPGKPIEETQRELGLKRVVKLASNENPLGPSPKAVKKMKASISEAHRYPDANAFRLKRALSKIQKFKPEQYLIGNGSNDCMDILVRALCQPGDQVVTSQGAFIAFGIAAKIQNCEVLSAPMTLDFRFDLNAILDLCRENSKVKAVYVANPNNPIGSFCGADEMKSFLLELKSIRGGEIVPMIDLAYEEYVFDSSCPSLAQLRKWHEGSVFLKTFSKVYGLADARVGYAIGPAELMGHCQKVRQPFNVGQMGLNGAEAALSDTAFVKKSFKLNQTEMKKWEAFFGQAAIPYVPSQGNFILIDTQKGLGLSGAETFKKCLKKGVIFRPVDNYGLPGMLRVSIGTEKENQTARAVFMEIFPKEIREKFKGKRKK